MKNYQLFADVVSYSPIRQQWLVAFNQNGTVEGLHPWSWHESKQDAIREAIRKTEFRLGITANCDDLYKHLDALNKQLKTKRGI